MKKHSYRLLSVFSALMASFVWWGTYINAWSIAPQGRGARQAMPGAFQQRLGVGQAVPADARLRSITAEEVISWIEPYAVESPGAVVVGVVDPSGQLVMSWGKDNCGRDANGDTIFETASISKALTGILLAQMAQSGEVKLNQPVSQLISCKNSCQKVTLLQCATHTAGFPDWPSNRGDTSQPYSSKDLQRYLDRCRLCARPGAVGIYSNTGFVVLGEALSKRADQSFDTLLRQRICTPLKMQDTGVGQPHDPKRLAFGHRKSGAVAKPSAPTASGAADGVRSTVHDLLKLTSACAGIRQTPLRGPIDKSCERYFKLHKFYDAGLGWFVDTRDGTVEKSGRIAGYRTHVAFSREKRVGVVVLAAWEEFPSPELGKELISTMIKGMGN